MSPKNRKHRWRLKIIYTDYPSDYKTILLQSLVENHHWRSKDPET